MASDPAAEIAAETVTNPFENDPSGVDSDDGATPSPTVLLSESPPWKKPRRQENKEEQQGDARDLDKMPVMSPLTAHLQLLCRPTLMLRFHLSHLLPHERGQGEGKLGARKNARNLRI